MPELPASHRNPSLPESPVRTAFISHTTPDDGYVAEMESFLRASGFDQVFNDAHSIQPDEKFWPEIETGIRNCDAFYVVITSASMNSEWVRREVEFARGLSKKIIPVWIEDCPVPDSFADRDVIDFRPRTRNARRIASSRILRHSPSHIFGREEWLDDLDAAWSARGRLHVYSLIAWGGAGKTSVVAHWVARRMSAQCWNGVERHFDWSFYSQGTKETSQGGADFFIAAALEFFGDPDPQAGNPWQRGQRLAELVRRQRTLLILDGIEPLQHPPNSPQAGELKDQALAALLQGLAMDNPGLCVVTSREPLKNLESFHGSSVEEKQLQRLTKEAAIALLQHLQLDGTEEEMEAAWKDAGGHALTLQLLGRFLADAHGGDIRRRREVDFQTADRETPGRTAMKVMRAYETWLASAGPERHRDLAVLRLMGLFDRPASPDCLSALRAEPAIKGLTGQIIGLEEWEWNTALTHLASLDLITVLAVSDQRSAISDQTSVDAHPLVREYFAGQLSDDHPQAFRAAQGRLFDHLCKTTEYRPDTLAGLRPLYEAVTHGCLAGRHAEACEEVYHARIQRGDEAFATKKLGAIGADLGAVAAFFDSPWRRPSPNLSEPDQAWLLSEAAYRLRALGRLSEAREPMRVGLERFIASKDWKNAAGIAGNLSELEVTLGRLGEAVDDGRRAIEFVGRTDEAYYRMSKRTIVADALHQRGERDEARALFEEAERMQAERQPEFPLLYSSPGFRYADLILAPAERAVWRQVLWHPAAVEDRETHRNEGTHTANADSHDEFGIRSASSATEPDAALAACAEAARRADRWFAWRTDSDSLLTIALDHLTLARAGLYRAILASVVPPVSALRDPAIELDRALDGLRDAGQLDELPKALLTASLMDWMKDEGGRMKAENYLFEAQLIAERGPMPLYLADVHLHRARLFHDLDELAKARTLIDRHDYGRRGEELSDAESAAANWHEETTSDSFLGT